MRRALVLPLVGLAALSMSLPASAATKPKPKPKPVVTIPACPSFTDPVGDDAVVAFGLAPVPSSEDPALDITGVKMSVANKTLSLTLSLTSVDAPTKADGVEYIAGFTLGGKVVELFDDETRSKPVMDQGFALNGIYIDGSYVSKTEGQVTTKIDTGAKTVTMSASLDDVAAAAGSKAIGLVGGLEARVRAVYVADLQGDDTAESKDAKLSLDGCK